MRHQAILKKFAVLLLFFAARSAFMVLLHIAEYFSLLGLLNDTSHQLESLIGEDTNK